ncbi:hypothetical protein NG99_07095 [Erwinia typographi]|uniref:Uncharacterized protein n=1 Tax=Erwinia typographi TaxID=371042 RepID=A0A0A3ZAT9_9GAMM|nr:hypothetical protein [Erwinia typographi]KGT94751.1 hypothetical protein NG99_07095 [Erwinia typographi]
MAKERYLFDVTTTDRIEHTKAYEDFIRSIRLNLPRVKKIEVTCYRAGNAVTELVMYHSEGSQLCLTIWEGKLSLPPLLPDNVRLSLLEISLQDVTDILILVTSLARVYRLAPYLPGDPHSSAVLTFMQEE